MSVEYTILDDGGEPNNAVNAIKKLTAENVDVILGPSLSPNGMAVIGFAAETKTPLIAAVGTDAVIYPMDERRRWIFKTAQANKLVMQVMVDHMAKNGIKTVGMLRLNDPLGEEWHAALVPLLEQAHITLTADERYLRSDNSITAQALRITAARPDAVLIAAAGGSSTLGQVALVDRNYRGKVYQTPGAAADDFIRLGGKAVEGALMAAGPLQVVDELEDSNPIKQVAMRYISAYQALYGSRPATFGANTFDAGIMLQAALPVAEKGSKPGTEAFRSALRDALENMKDVVGTQGVFSMTPENHNGMDQRAALMMEVRDAKWQLLR
jgi:branched-chain amino acid transport system substrate-binding protein